MPKKYMFEFFVNDSVISKGPYPKEVAHKLATAGSDIISMLIAKHGAWPFGFGNTAESMSNVVIKRALLNWLDLSGEDRFLAIFGRDGHIVYTKKVKSDLRRLLIGLKKTTETFSDDYWA